MGKIKTIEHAALCIWYLKPNRLGHEQIAWQNKSNKLPKIKARQGDSLNKTKLKAKCENLHSA